MVDTTVKTSADYVRTLGNLFLQWSNEVNRARVDLEMANISPGSLPSAVALKTDYNTSKQKWQDNFGNLRLALHDAGVKLIDMADRYSGAEDLNSADAEKLRDVIEAIAVYYPGVEKVIDAEPGGSPSPPSNQGSGQGSGQGNGQKSS